jgi:hypothetical protein
VRSQAPSPAACRFCTKFSFIPQCCYSLWYMAINSGSDALQGSEVQVRAFPVPQMRGTLGHPGLVTDRTGSPEEPLMKFPKHD